MAEYIKRQGEPEKFHCFDNATPDVFYKFRVWSLFDTNGNRTPNVLHQSMLEKCEVFFASALDFNDPFDGRIPLRYDRLSKQDRLRIIEAHTKNRFPKMRKHHVRNHARSIESKQHWRNKKNIAHIQNTMLGKIGVFSASEGKDDLKLWTHYADSHKGFCVGFDTYLFDSYCHEIVNHLPEGKAPIITGYPMSYAADMPLLVPNRMRWEKKVIGPLLTKSEEYAHEKEIRFFNLNNSRCSVSVPRQCIKEVILGCKILKQDEVEIAELLRRKMPHVSLYRAYMRNDAYGLEFQQCEE